MQYKVPQNIDMADRIVGPLTLVQFLYLLVGGIIIYFLLSTVAPISTSLFTLLALPIAIFTLAMSFLKVQDQPFPKFVAAAVQFVRRPKNRVWLKEGIDPNLVITKNEANHKEVVIVHKQIKRSELDRLAQALDTGTQVTRLPGDTSRTIKTAPMAAPNHLKRGRPTLDNVGGKK